jgi:signal peptidase II
MANLLEKIRSLQPHTRMFAIVASVLFVLDQWTKYLAIAHLTNAFSVGGTETLGFWDKISRFLWTEHPARSGRVEVLENFWHFVYVENPGAAWGFLANSGEAFRTPFFLIVSVAAMAFIISYFRKTTEGQTWLRVALACVFSGAVGNFVDRVRLGYVIDFIDWHWYDSARWPTFNVADAAISVGVVMLLIDSFVNRESSDTAKGAEA